MSTNTPTNMVDVWTLCQVQWNRPRPEDAQDPFVVPAVLAVSIYTSICKSDDASKSNQWLRSIQNRPNMNALNGPVSLESRT